MNRVSRTFTFHISRTLRHFTDDYVARCGAISHADPAARRRFVLRFSRGGGRCYRNPPHLLVLGFKSATTFSDFMRLVRPVIAVAKLQGRR